MSYKIMKPNGEIVYGAESFPCRGMGLYIIKDADSIIFRGINAENAVSFHIYEDSFTRRYLRLVLVVRNFILSPENRDYPEYEIGWLKSYQNPALRRVNDILDVVGYIVILCLELLRFPELDGSLAEILRYDKRFTEMLQIYK